jgi:hypothetical protein
MRRTASITFACALTALAGGAAPAVAQKPAPKASVSVAACHSDVKPLARRFRVVGDMFSLRQGNRMEMRFEVFSKTPTDETWRLVESPELGIWNRARPDRTQYRVGQKIVNLTAPASYKARVTFHWAGPGTQDTVTKRWSKVCEQRDPRPNLRLARLEARPLNAKEATYVVQVRNVGASVTTGDSGFEIALAVDGVTRPTSDPILGLRPGASIQVNFRAPRCKQGGTIRATVDPYARIDQSDRADDVLELPCPASLA